MEHAIGNLKNYAILRGPFIGSAEELDGTAQGVAGLVIRQMARR